MTASLSNTLTDVPGLKVGHAHDDAALTGCTVVICEAGATGGVDQRGGAPGTRETDLMRPVRRVEHAHAVLLTGGSAFGLNAATGVMQHLEERGIGYDVRVTRVPIVPAAVLFDLDFGDTQIRPDAEMGYAACQAASNKPVMQGCVGAGMGARVGGIYGPKFVTKSGIGSASIDVDHELIVGALVAVNAFGDVIDPDSREILAGARQPPDGDTFAGTLSTLRTLVGKPIFSLAAQFNTVIGVVASNARLTKEETNKVAQMAQNGIARTVRPAHTMLDGDTLFALSTGNVEADVNIIGAYAAEVMAQAVVNAVRAASPLGGLPSASSMQNLDSA